MRGRDAIVVLGLVSLFAGSLGCRADREELCREAARKYVSLMMTWHGAQDTLAGCEAGLKDRLLHADTRQLREALRNLGEHSGKALSRCILRVRDMERFARECHWVVTAEEMARFGEAVRETYLGKIVLRGVRLTALADEIRSRSIAALESDLR